jgi:hypothetical protein
LATSVLVAQLIELQRARADVTVTDLLDEQGRFDLLSIRARGLGHLIKTVTVRQEVHQKVVVEGEGEDAEARIEQIPCDASR